MATVFISHRTDDTPAAKRLASDLQSLGHEPRLDAEEIRVGDSLPGWMNDAIGSCDAVIICFSSAGVETPWMSREWLSVLSRRLNGDGILLLPFRLPESQPPPLLADLRYADASIDWQQAVAELDQAIRERHEV